MTMPYAVPANLDQWASDVEWVGGLPAADTPGLVAWGAAEGGSFNNSAYANVLNTTLPESGSTPINSVGVQSFAIPGDTQSQDWLTGIEADLATIAQPNMAQIETSLQSGAPSTLPTALAQDNWGTNPATVASILGETPAQLTAVGTAGGNGGATGPATAQLTSYNLNPLDLFGIPQTVAGSAASSIWKDVGPFLVKSILVVTGLGVMVIGVYKLTDLPSQRLGKSLQGAGPALDAAAAA